MSFQNKALAFVHNWFRNSSSNIRSRWRLQCTWTVDDLSTVPRQQDEAT